MFGVSDSAFRMPLFIRASLSEPHTTGTALQRHVCMPVCLSVCDHVPKINRNKWICTFQICTCAKLSHEG